MSVGSNVLVVGANSDLISPFFGISKNNSLSVLGISRQQWDLTDTLPPENILNEILTFSPNHLVFAAGINTPIPITSPSSDVLEAIRTHITINCISFVSLVTTLQSRLSNHLTSIHALSSLYGIYGRKSRLPYSLSKHALEGSIKCLAIEYPDTLVLAYRPGFFKTKMTEKNLSLTCQQDLVKKIPASRLGTPHELSSLIASNILNPPLYSSGTAITLDGGLTAGGIFEI